MIIGYDGKRAFQNKTGLGNYSRSLICILHHFYPHNNYILFAPKQTDLFEINAFEKIKTVLPPNSFYKKFTAIWRRYAIVKAITKSGVNIYHGLSNELPLGIESTLVKTVVTVHDLIFERYPATYNFEERFVHRWKIKKACKIADAVIAISNQTKVDLIKFYGVDEKKIFLCYQSCNPIFEKKFSVIEKETVKKKYNLPDKYFLFVSSIAPRKNLITICKAMIYLKDKLNIPLVIIGDGKKEKAEVKQLLKENDFVDRFIFLNESAASKEQSFITAADFPAIYQQAITLIYPSFFEGFGLPILEALWSGLPVICSNISSMPEVAGDAALYFTPTDYITLSAHMINITTNTELADDLITKGYAQAQKFAPEKYAESIIHVYNNIL